MVYITIYILKESLLLLNSNNTTIYRPNRNIDHKSNKKNLSLSISSWSNEK